MKKKFMKNAKLLLGIIAALALPGCLQNETTITLNKDGSGTIVEETLLSAQMMEMMTQFAQPGQPDPIAGMFSEEKAKAKAAKFGEGVEYVKTDMFEKDGRKGARMHYRFADINKITASPQDAVENLGGEQPPAEGEKEKKENVKFAYADGKLRIIVPPTDFDEMNMEDEEGADPQQKAMMEQMMADMRITMKLVIADGIAETNASYVEGDTITLFDVEVGKMLGHKEALKKISETAKTDMDAAKAEVTKLDGIKFETKEDVTVTVK